jgi:hypothetical protein
MVVSRKLKGADALDALKQGRKDATGAAADQEERYGKDRTASARYGHSSTLDGVAAPCRFHGMTTSSFAMPHQPLIPANNRPAPMKPDRA